jgi:hypothetical protein
MEKYKKKHYPENQKMIVEGIPVNPILRDSFDFTPHDERDKDEINDWWNLPYIKIIPFHQESWIEHYHRLRTECN